MPDATPTPNVQRLAIKLRPAAEKQVKRGHPWIFADSIARVNKSGQAGDLAVVFDRRKNQFLGIGLWDPHSPIRIKMIHTGLPLRIDAGFFRKRITEARAKRASLLETRTTSYRLVFGENDGLPGLICDIYDRVLVLKVYSAIWRPWLDVLLPILREITGVESGILRLSRILQRSRDWPAELRDGHLLFGATVPEQVAFLEHGLRFLANPVRGHKTGYFLDHRHNRRRIGQLARDKTVLDVFAYAGGFSVHALAGGASTVLAIDVSAQALEMARENARLNGLEDKLETWAVDAFAGLEHLQKQGRTFDIVVIDPPAFAKKEAEVPAALHNYRRLIRLAILLVAPEGILLSCSCSSRVDREQFFQVNESTLQASGRKYQLLERTDHDLDHPIGFPEGAYLKSLYYRLG